MLFRACKEENHPSRLVCEALSHTKSIKQFKTIFPFLQSIQMPNVDSHTMITVLGIYQNVADVGDYIHTQKFTKF